MKMVIDGGDLKDALESVSTTSRQEAVILLQDDQWIMKAQDPGEVLMAAVLTPAESMEEYDPGDYDRLGLRIEQIKNFIQSRTSTITMEMKDYNLHISDGDLHAELGTIDPDSVEGVVGIPDIEYEVSVWGEPDFIRDFISVQDNVVGAGSYKIGPREDGIYLYASGDSEKMDTFVPYEDFEDYRIDWEINNQPPDDSGHIPSEDKAIDTSMSTEMTQTMKMIEDTCRIDLANHMPMKFVFDKSTEDGEGMKVSFIQAPRISTQGKSIIPKEVTDGSQ